MIWYGTEIDAICSEETFRSLVELAFSLDPGYQYKTSLNALLCALCSRDTRLFSLLLENCEGVLVGEASRSGHRLNTLAQVAQSHSCTEVLLDSNLITRMVSRLTNGFEKLLDMVFHPVAMGEGAPEGDSVLLETPLKNNAKDTVIYLCNLLAFFSDFMRNWRPGKLWMASEDNCRFWCPMLQFLCMDSCIVSSLELSFVQEVAYEFFSVCLQGCDTTKRVFVQLVCDTLSNNFHSSGTSTSSEHVLTPFLHRLLGGLIFQHESIPVIIRVLSPEVSGNSVTPPENCLSLPSTVESHEFHPSYPIGESYYYLHIPGSSSLAQFEALIKSNKTAKTSPVHNKAEPKPSPEKPLHKKWVTSSKHTPARPVAVVEETNSLSITNFELKTWKVLSLNKDKQKNDAKDSSSDMSFYVCQYDDDNLDLSSLSCLKLKKQSRDLLCDIVSEGCGYPISVAIDNREMLFNAEHSVTKNVDMYSMFVSCNGLLPLAKAIPKLYPYHWPATLGTATSKQTPSDEPVSQGGLFKSHAILYPPVFLTFRSILMFGLCLQLESFGKVLRENPSAAFILMRLLLGEETCMRGECDVSVCASVGCINGCWCAVCN